MKMPQTPLEVIDQCLEYFKNPLHWHKGSAYKNLAGTNCSQDDAASACIDGALCLFTGTNIPLYLTTADGLEDVLIRLLPKKYNIISYNDDPLTEHKDVVYLLQKYQQRLTAEKIKKAKGIVRNPNEGN